MIKVRKCRFLIPLHLCKEFLYGVELLFITDMGKKFISQPLTAGGTPHQPGDIYKFNVGGRYFLRMIDFCQLVELHGLVMVGVVFMVGPAGLLALLPRPLPFPTYVSGI